MTIFYIILIAVILICTTISLIMLYKLKNRDNKNISTRIDELEKKFDTKITKLQSFCQDNEVALDDLKEYLHWRQYLIDTNFCGALKNKELLKEWVNSFKTNGLSNDTHEKAFKRFKEALSKNGYGYLNPDSLSDKIGILLDLEDKQRILDRYKEETKKVVKDNGNKRKIKKDDK